MFPICKIDDCSKYAYARGWCDSHYRKWLRSGSTLDKKFGPAPRPLAERFWEKVVKGSDDECWIWQGGIQYKRKGYGVMWVTEFGREIGAHRISVFLRDGKWAKNFVCHSCDNPPCVNPKHLWEGTAADNNRDRDKKNRSKPRGKIL